MYHGHLVGYLLNSCSVSITKHAIVAIGMFFSTFGIVLLNKNLAHYFLMCKLYVDNKYYYKIYLLNILW